MKHRVQFILIPVLLAAFAVIIPRGAFAAINNHSTWDDFLKQFVNQEGQVDFQGIHSDPTLLNQYNQQLKELDFVDFDRNWPREEKLALWLNAYHAGILKIINQHYPIRSIHDIPGVWNLPIVEIGNGSFSLNQIRNNKLIQVYRDEKIHLALACGAKSCPRFPRESFVGLRVEGQLFIATRELVNDPVYSKIIPGEKKVWLSRIFKWYAADFKLDFGYSDDILHFTEEEAAVLSFMVHYLESLDKIEYLEEGKYKVKYLPFDWSLNEWRPSAVS